MVLSIGHYGKKVGKGHEGGAIFVGSSAITGARDGLHVESNL